MSAGLVVWLSMVGPGAGGAANDDSHYCGIYCVFAALRSIGRPASLPELCRGEYVGSLAGSSLEQLERAVRDQGGSARAVTGMSVAALRASRWPVILHIRPPGYGTPHVHWVAYLGASANGQARVVDPPRPVAEMPFAELVALWDGSALVVAPEPVSFARIAGPAWAEAAIILVGTVAALYGFRRWLRRSWAGATAIGLTAAAVAAATHLAGEDGFARHPDAVGLVTGRHHDPNLPVVTLDEMRSLARDPGALIVDCRLPAQFHGGHIPGATNLPIVAGPAEHAAFFSGVPRDRTVVVYCQTESCSWSRSIATAAFHRGFSDTRIYKGGWEEWHAASASGGAAR